MIVEVNATWSANLPPTVHIVTTEWIRQILSRLRSTLYIARLCVFTVLIHINQSINIRLLWHGKMHANNSKQKAIGLQLLHNNHLTASFPGQPG